MLRSLSRVNRMSRTAGRLLGLIAVLGSLLVAGLAAGAGNAVDLTLMFHGGVQGKIAPCG
jgi:hypothetical protein